MTITDECLDDKLDTVSGYLDSELLDNIEDAGISPTEAKIITVVGPCIKTYQLTITEKMAACILPECVASIKSK